MPGRRLPHLLISIWWILLAAISWYMCAAHWFISSNEPDIFFIYISIIVFCVSIAQFRKKVIQHFKSSASNAIKLLKGKFVLIYFYFISSLLFYRAMAFKKDYQLNHFAHQTASFVYKMNTYAAWDAPGMGSTHYEFMINNKTIVKRVWDRKTYTAGQFVLIEYSEKNPKIARIIRQLSLTEYENYKNPGN